MRLINEKNNTGVGDTPVFSEDVYKLLPRFLQRVVNPFEKNDRERDVVLFSSLITLSGLFPKVVGLYAKEPVYANLYGIIIAPPGSGKGSAKYGTYLANEIASYLETMNQSDLLRNKKSTDESVKNDNTSQKPIRRSFFLPANSGATFLIKQIKANEGNGNFIFDSEADTLSTALNQEWGRGISELLRKAYHHESTSLGRAKDDLLISINYPKLSMLLTGTPNQLGGIIKSVEDGLFSRCLFYKFNEGAEWQDVSPGDNSMNYDKYFSGLSKEVHQMYTYYLSKEFTFRFSKEQYENLNLKFRALLNKTVTEYSNYSQGIIYRMGIMFFRMCMIFSLIEKFPDKDQSDIISCSENAYDLSGLIIDSLTVGSLEIFKNGYSEHIGQMEDKKQQFYDKLPNVQFKRSEAIDLGVSLKLSKRTIDNYLFEKFKQGFLEKVRNGEYCKVAKLQPNQKD